MLHRRERTRTLRHSLEDTPVDALPTQPGLRGSRHLQRAVAFAVTRTRALIARPLQRGRCQPADAGSALPVAGAGWLRGPWGGAGCGAGRAPAGRCRCARDERQRCARLGGPQPPGSLPGCGICLIIGTVMGGPRNLTVRAYRPGTTLAC